MSSLVPHPPPLFQPNFNFNFNTTKKWSDRPPPAPLLTLTSSTLPLSLPDTHIKSIKAPDPFTSLTQVTLFISLFLNHVFIIFKPLSLHNSIKQSPFSFLPSKPYLPTTSLTSLSPTFAFISPITHNFSSSPNPPKMVPRLSQKTSLSSLLLSLPGPYTLTTTHLSLPIFILTHNNLGDTHLYSLTHVHHSSFINNPTPSLALTLSLTPDTKPLTAPN